MDRRIDELPLLGNGRESLKESGIQRVRNPSSISVPPQLQLTLSWKDLVVDHHPSRGIIGRLRGERPPPVKRILKGGKTVLVTFGLLCMYRVIAQ